ncbi:hypothetical protein [Mycolicibacterium llatzerense]|uniref:hypothetical protein n=1 Tax=Mycolicibacterium llatzerense TaxID=280871 RepID=UPI0008DD175C|nr:hypothetical protein [Mycolicibacterium llatzerense]
MISPPTWTSPGDRVADLVPGLKSLGPLPIPYALLPTRVRTAFGASYVRWSELENVTVRDLRARPGAGHVTVRALLAAAAQAVAAHRATAGHAPANLTDALTRLRDAFNERDRAVLSALVWTAEPLTYRQLMPQLGVTTGWMERNVPRTRARFIELLAHPDHRLVRAAGTDLRARLGPYAPAAVVDTELRRAGLDPRSPAASLLLSVAGPYLRRGDWFENAAAGGRDAVAAAVDDVYRATPAPTLNQLRTALSGCGVPVNIADTYLATLPLREINGVYVRWKTQVFEQIEAILHATGAPATATEIQAALEPTTPDVPHILGTLSRSRRFVRTSRTRWGLREWGPATYSGVVEAISTRIVDAGGRLSTRDLVDDICGTFPDVTESSVRTYLTSLAFVVEDGMVRHRTDADPWPTPPALNTARGAFRLGDSEIRVAVDVTAEVLRGSGYRIGAAVATAIGLRPGQQLQFATPHGAATASWPLTHAPSIGSVRAFARAVGADVGDILVLVFRLPEKTLGAVAISADTIPALRLADLTGLPTVTRLGLAAALACPPAEIEQILESRGDGDLAAASTGLRDE